jgi:hypothetical protein
MRRTIVALLVVAVTLTALGSAATDTEYRDAILTLYSRGSFGALTRDWCDERAPKLKAQSARIFQAWWQEQGLAEVEARVKAVYSAEQIANLKAKVDGVRQGTYTKLDQLFPDATARCQDLRGYYQQFLNLRQDNADLYTTMNSRAFPSSGTAPAPPSSPAATPATKPPASSSAPTTGILYTVPQLNTLVINTLAGIKGGNADKLRGVLVKLQSLGTIYLSATVLRDHILGFEQGKFRSKYVVYCVCTRAGQDERIGKTLTVRGTVKDFTTTWIELEAETVQGTTGLKRSNLPDNLGLERKPLTVQEVRTKPGAGLPLSALEGVYFNQTAENRMDGFGNLSVERRSETYLLLKDGSAYRYTWSFTPQDFNAAYAKHEQPNEWQRWTRKSGNYQLTDSQGRTTSLSNFSRINPVPKGSRWKRTYDYLTVNAASQNKVFLEFNLDGTFVTTSTTPLVGGFVAEGYVSSTPPASNESRGRYEIDGYTLTFKTDDGRVSRMFFGVPDFEKNPRNPEWIFFGGRLYSL